MKLPMQQKKYVARVSQSFTNTTMKKTKKKRLSGKRCGSGPGRWVEQKKYVVTT